MSARPKTPTAALVGYGKAGKFIHAPLLQASPLHLKSIVTTRSEEAIFSSKEVQRVGSIMDVLLDEDISVVILATPNHRHFDQAQLCLEHGKNVVVDKPAVLSLAHADALIRASRAKNRFVSVFQNRRWDSDYLTLRELVRNGHLGEVKELQLFWPRHRFVPTSGWREEPQIGAGIMWDLGSHLLDQTLQILGKPDWIFTDPCQLRGGARVTDRFQMTLGYSRTRAIIGASFIGNPLMPRIFASGSNGRFTKYGLDVQEDQLKAGMNPHNKGFGVEPPELHGTFVSANGHARTIPSMPGSWRSFYASISEAAAGTSDPPVPIEEVRAAIGLLEWASAPAHENTPVFAADTKDILSGASDQTPTLF